MTAKRVLLSGVAVGFCVSVVVLALLWFGVVGFLNVGRTDLMPIFWPSSLMLTTSWRSTAAGIATTVVSVGINCLLYMAVAYGVYCFVRTFGRSARS